MTLHDAIQQAVGERELIKRAELVREVCDFMRFTMKCDYEKSWRLVNAATGISVGEWEELLRQADDY